MTRENMLRGTDVLSCADELRLSVSPTLDPKRRSDFGQFMTQAPIARYMAGLYDTLPTKIRLLDPGAGMGALTAAFVQEAIGRDKKPDAISVTAYEVDKTLTECLRRTLAQCGELCADHIVKFDFEIIPDDFVLHSAEPLIAGSPQYDCVITNPPYAKIHSKSRARAALRSMNIETSNLYTAFVAVALTQLKAGGQLVAITPRSFCNGRYFEPFRKLLTTEASFEDIHVYGSRRKAFADDDVLQENIIYRLVKGKPQSSTVSITSSSSPQDPEIERRRVPFTEVIHSNDQHRYIHLVLSDAGAELATKVRALTCRLQDLGLTVSTGRVVDFRAREHLRKDANEDTVPLIYPGHFEAGFVAWPKVSFRKHNALDFNDETHCLTVPRGTYVLTKRFTSKEEKRRIVAAVYDGTHHSNARIGFENHLNYFHANGGGISRSLHAGFRSF